MLFLALGVPFTGPSVAFLFTDVPEKLFQFEALFPALAGSILSIEFFEVESPKYQASPVLPTISTTFPALSNNLTISPPLFRPPWPKLVAKSAVTLPTVLSSVLSMRK